MKFISSFSSVVLLATSAFAAPTPAPAAPGFSKANTKRGLAYNSDQPHAAKLFTSEKISWGYNWGSTRAADDLPSNVQEYVPMCWGESPHANCKAGLAQSVAAGATNILGFNEPDIESQANMTPDYAAHLWRELMEPYAGRVRLGSPAVSNSEDPGKGLNWLSSFLERCTDCRIDFIAIHWYAESGDFEYFKRCINKAHAVSKAAGFDVPIWVTEFGAPTYDLDVQVNFVKKATAWMDQNPLIERYSYFGALEGAPVEAKMVTGGILNSVGMAYNN